MFGQSQLRDTALLMNLPLGISTDSPNNVWMEELSEKERVVDVSRATRQWMQLYHFLASQALIYVIPTVQGLQDQVYTANLGIVLPHLANTAVVASFRSQPRIGESEPGLRFLKDLGYDVHVAPNYFEGEADLKFLKDNVYVGAKGIRTSEHALRWFRDTFDMDMIELAMKDEYLYHLDCVMLPLSVDAAAVCTSVVDPQTVKAIEQHVRVYDVPLNLAYGGLTNSVRVGKTILCCSNIEEMKATDEYYDDEKQKITLLEKICAHEGFEPIFFNLSEFMKSGAMLSCCVMRLNYHDFVSSNIAAPQKQAEQLEALID